MFPSSIPVYLERRVIPAAGRLIRGPEGQEPRARHHSATLPPPRRPGTSASDGKHETCDYKLNPRLVCEADTRHNPNRVTNSTGPPDPQAEEEGGGGGVMKTLSALFLEKPGAQRFRLLHLCVWRAVKTLPKEVIYYAASFSASGSSFLVRHHPATWMRQSGQGTVGYDSLPFSEKRLFRIPNAQRADKNTTQRPRRIQDGDSPEPRSVRPQNAVVCEAPPDSKMQAKTREYSRLRRKQKKATAPGPERQAGAAGWWRHPKRQPLWKRSPPLSTTTLPSAVRRWEEHSTAYTHETTWRISASVIKTEDSTREENSGHSSERLHAARLGPIPPD
ncbi:hypothetical protein SKAU_G00394520 [Synaphobranchus kaupii]|uniref:Uncharacterized protein n=1 Tax=Synaphobranchus kaupii TaxID=118154 RepID=A0A9Q1EC60_SYNKA|nr:hypothetical protein SKAU_G00394520 [Synaphobranchus kaupii]